jgi:hypothetical protein
LVRNAQSRREWGLAGLVLVIYGLAVSPLAHALLQHQGLERLDSGDQAWASHRNGSSPERRQSPFHASDERDSDDEGSLQHLTALGQPAAEPPCAPERLLLHVAWITSGEERERLGAAPTPPGMPQGP